MIQPSLDKLVEHVVSNYTLVVLAAKRAREIVGADSPQSAGKSNKPVTVSLYEIFSDKITYERTKTGIK
ncbi:MAG: DNA-directed RNA polymerase subunit omega [Acidaminococcales bacterium]|jgi:DNA-directed RNA polymerase subunit omega|nr:DNA-directed RNA polymerase subunit omega [Acidaminococcales bacterium]